MTEHHGSGFTLDTAIAIATKYHAGQADWNGTPYTNHLRAVADQLQGDDSKMAGMLHDSIEDTSLTEDELRRLGCPENVIEAVVLVTHKVPHPNEEEYMADIRNIAESGNQIAVDVKWADLTHNSDLTRLAHPQERDFDRRSKYQRAKKILKPLVSKYLLEK